MNSSLCSQKSRHLNLNWELTSFLLNLLQCSLNLYDNDYSVMLICLILFISSLPAFSCECMFGLCHAWPGVVVFYFQSQLGCILHSSVFSQEELVLLKETEVHLSQGFHLCMHLDGRGCTAQITDGVTQFRPQGRCPNKKTELGWKKYSLYAWQILCKL